MTFIKSVTVATFPVVLCCLSLNVYAAQNFDQYVAVKATVSRTSDKFNAVGTDHGHNESDAISGNDHKTVGGADFAYGLDLSKKGFGLRAEVEIGFSNRSKYNAYWPANNDGTREKLGVKIEKSSVLLNAYYDFHNSSSITPYIVAGIGFANVKASFSEFDGGFGVNQSRTKLNFAWQLGAGVSYAATDKLSIDFGYRYVDYGNVKQHVSYYGGYVTTDTKVTTREHQLYLGARFTFR